MQQPDLFLDQLGIELPCIVDESRMAQLDAEHRVFINYEAYYCADDRSRKKFSRKPWKYLDEVTDPVSKRRFHPDKRSPEAEHAGRRFFFQSEGNREAFLGMADSLAVPVVPHAGMAWYQAIMDEFLPMEECEEEGHSSMH